MMDEVGIEHPSKHYCPYLTSDLNSEIERLHIIGGDYLALASDFLLAGMRFSAVVRCTMKPEKYVRKTEFPLFIIIMPMNSRNSSISPLWSCLWKIRIRNM